MTFDIRSLAIASTANMPVTDVEGNVQKNAEGQELSITFYSPGTKEYLRAAHRRQEKRSKAAVAMMQGKEAKTTPEDEINDTADFLAEITVSLNGFDYSGGPKALFRDIEIGHIAEDADKFVKDRANFKRSSAAA